MLLALALYAACRLVHFAAAASIAFDPSGFKVDGLHSSIGIFSSKPLLSWRFIGLARGAVMTKYQLRATSGSESIWDTGLVFSNISRCSWEGRALKSREAIVWQVNAWDEHNEETGWSDPASFEVALLDNSDWSAKWITNSAFLTGNTSLPYFARDFEVDCDVTSARLYHVGLGLGASTINGQNVSSEVLAPGLTTYNRTVYYSTDDVTTLLRSGANTLGIALGKGIYDAERPLEARYKKLIGSTQPLQTLVQLEYACADGSMHVAASGDDEWRTTVSGPLWESSWYGGEEYDARKELLGWDSPGYDRSSWTTPQIISVLSPDMRLIARPYPPLQVVDTFAAVDIHDKGNGSYIVDFGTNYAGWYRVSMVAAPGVRVTFRPAEILVDGNITQRTTGQPIFDRYTFKSSEREVYTPQFLYHGMRYLLVEGLPNPLSLRDATGLVIRVSNEAVGDFNTDNDMLNSIWGIIDRSVQSNMYSVLTDCPHREKLGWIEQDHLVYSAIERFYDFQAHGASIIASMADAQLENGLVTSTAPEYAVFSGGYRDDVNWGSAYIHMALYLYQSYGDMSLLTTHYDGMKRYAKYLDLKAVNYIMDGGLGDWGQIPAISNTPKNLTATWGYQRAINSLANVASIIGQVDDAAAYSDQAESIRNAFYASFWNATTNDTFANGAQGSDAFGLSLELPVEAAAKQRVVEHLVSDIRSRSNHTGVGEVALPSLFRSLAASGNNDVVVDLLTRTDYPSYGYVLSFGATSMSEYWDGANGSSSQAHFMMGAAQEWFTAELAGIKQRDSNWGYRFFDIQPYFARQLNRVSSSFQSPQGIIAITWSRDVDGAISIDIEVPVGSIASLKLAVADLELDGKPVTAAVDVLNVVHEAPFIIATVGSGRYAFRAKIEAV
ncbi:bacterial alpha-L-rhamnosidase-domain-containing protein [Auriculariales sp. MPI-PUGE-AT-0066]|nr:bacterial alpha-L-rhamnosidase-domain-containing protein [Auriculariales sp. MPI-PUGE-AT-0066]